eukprot:COSAG02_NODE_1397_length_12873_cov_18.498043_3_plen_155_part_00
MNNYLIGASALSRCGTQSLTASGFCRNPASSRPVRLSCFRVAAARPSLEQRAGPKSKLILIQLSAMRMVESTRGDSHRAALAAHSVAGKMRDPPQHLQSSIRSVPLSICTVELAFAVTKYLCSARCIVQLLHLHATGCQVEEAHEHSPGQRSAA